MEKSIWRFELEKENIRTEKLFMAELVAENSEDAGLKFLREFDKPPHKYNWKMLTKDNINYEKEKAKYIRAEENLNKVIEKWQNFIDQKGITYSIENRPARSLKSIQKSIQNQVENLQKLEENLEQIIKDKEFLEIKGELFK